MIKRMTTFRPGPDELDWDDNAVSNALAFLSVKMAPNACQPDHWTTRLADKLWAACSCCLFMRGAIIGGMAGFAFGGMVMYSLAKFI
jgi:hypothetical protein